MQPNYNFYGYNPYQQPQQYQSNQLIVVNNLEEVQQYIVHSNRPIYFKVNGEKQLFVEKKVDINGNVVTDIFELTKYNNSKIEFATLNDIEILKQEILRLRSIIEGNTYEQSTN